MRSGSPFYHFKSKHEILFTVTTEGIEVMLRNLEMVIARQQPARECFEACVITHMNYLLGPGRDFAWVMLYESRLLDPTERAVVHCMSARYEEVFSAVLDRLVASGDLRDASAIARKLILGAINWSAQWYDENGASDPQAIAQQLCALVLREKTKLVKISSRGFDARGEPSAGKAIRTNLGTALGGMHETLLANIDSNV